MFVKIQNYQLNYQLKYFSCYVITRKQKSLNKKKTEKVPGRLFEQKILKIAVNPVSRTK